MHGTRMGSLAGLVICLVALAGFQHASLTLTGTVREAGTGRPLAGAAVRVVEAGSVDARIAIADADGRYRLTALPLARYEVSARMDGFLDGRVGQARVGAPGRLVDLKTDGTVADIVLWRGAVITGVVYGSDGRPTSGFEVATLKRDMEFGQSRLSPAGRPARCRVTRVGHTRRVGDRIRLRAKSRRAADGWSGEDEVPARLVWPEVAVSPQARSTACGYRLSPQSGTHNPACRRLPLWRPTRHLRWMSGQDRLCCDWSPDVRGGSLQR